jgi:hypothetical protein
VPRRHTHHLILDRTGIGIDVDLRRTHRRLLTREQRGGHSRRSILDECGLRIAVNRPLNGKLEDRAGDAGALRVAREPA